MNALRIHEAFASSIRGGGAARSIMQAEGFTAHTRVNR